MANKKQVNLIHCEGTEISRVIYPLGILMAGEMNYTHPQKRLMVINPLEHFHQKKPFKLLIRNFRNKTGEKKISFVVVRPKLLEKIKIIMIENCQ